MVPSCRIPCLEFRVESLYHLPPSFFRDAGAFSGSKKLHKMFELEAQDPIVGIRPLAEETGHFLTAPCSGVGLGGFLGLFLS